MQLLINDQQAITGYVTTGSVEQGIEYTGSIPDGFETNFKPSFYLLQNGVIVANQNYVAPVEPTPDSGPTAEQQAIAKLTTLVTGLMAKEAVNNA
uniref:Hypothetical 10.0K protein n=1 Tax=Lactobacillus phage phi-gle TaxID=126649 RepID=Q7M292_9CAUD